MANIVCYDSDGSILNHYTQWDTDQELVIMGADVSTAPVFHFLNAYITTAYVVQSEIDGNSIVVSVPDIFLQYDVPLIVYIYYEPGTTEYSVRIPVMPRTKPSDYVYVDPGTGGGGSSSVTNITIANDLTTDDPEAALSAAQGVIIKALIDSLDEEKLDTSELDNSITAALTQAKESGDFKGDKGDKGDTGNDGAPGRGIISVVRTSGNGAAGTTDIYTITYTDSTTSTFNVYNGANGVSTGGDGSESSGAGENGATFTPYVDAEGNLSWSNDKGLANPTTVNIKGPAGTPGANGNDGLDGSDGVSPTISISEIDGGHRITIVDVSGTHILEVMDGSDGEPGVAGKDGQSGYTPVKGTDYWTSSDKDEIVNDVLAALPTWTGGSY